MHNFKLMAHWPIPVWQCTKSEQPELHDTDRANHTGCLKLLNMALEQGKKEWKFALILQISMTIWKITVFFSRHIVSYYE